MTQLDSVIDTIQTGIEQESRNYKNADANHEPAIRARLDMLVAALQAMKQYKLACDTYTINYIK